MTYLLFVKHICLTTPNIYVLASQSLTLAMQLINENEDKSKFV